MLAESHGRRSVDLIRVVAPHLDADAEAARIEQEEIENARCLQALPGARELVESVPPERFAIVTSGTRPLAVARLAAAGIAVPEVLVTAEQVEHGKPDPEGYRRAAALLGVEPAHRSCSRTPPRGRGRPRRGHDGHRRAHDTRRVGAAPCAQPCPGSERAAARDTSSRGRVVDPGRSELPRRA